MREATPAQQGWGYALGLLGVFIFAMTLPMTRLAVGDASAPQLPPLFVTAGRAAGAGVLSMLWLRWQGVPWPPRHLWAAIGACAVGTVLGFPLFLSLALRQVPSVHAAVITGVLPLATAVAAALLMRQRARPAFWALAALGCALVLAFAWLHGGGHLSAADGLLLAAVACAAVGYVYGAKVTAALSAEQAICWVLVFSWPWSAAVSWMAWPPQLAQVSAAAWTGFAYVTVFSMWLGFFAWYRGLAWGGVMRVSQVQLLQPFLSMIMAVPVLGEPVEGLTLGFALAVAVVVYLGRRFAGSPRSLAATGISSPSAARSASPPDRTTS